MEPPANPGRFTGAPAGRACRDLRSRRWDPPTHAGCGHLDRLDERGAATSRVSPGFEAQVAFAPPDELWSTPRKVKQQGETNACTGFSLATVLEYLLERRAPGSKAEEISGFMLYSMAQSQGLQVLGLEDTKEHFESLDSFSREEQLTMLRAVLKRTQAEKEKDYEALLKAYLAGDTAKIGLLDDDITGGMLPKALWDKMRVKLLDERNVRMAERIVSEANQNPVFVAVGASHLAGKGGLIERLRAAGYKVTKVQ